MMLSLRTHTTALTKANGRTRSVRVYAAKQKLAQSGFINRDNSGKGNIFPTKQAAFYSSPRTQAAASQGLGGAQGGTVLAGALGVVALATVLVLNQGSGETLNQIQTSDIESLTTIAARIAKSI